jgi:hypothetical protein
MSDICSDDERYGGFGAAVANLLHRRDRAAPTGAEAADVAAPAPAMAAAQSALAPAVAAARAGTKMSPPVAVAARTWLTKTKRPYKRAKKALQPAAVPAPTAALAPASLVGVGGAAVSAFVEKKPPAILPSVDKPTHPCGILVEIVGTTVSCQGRSCEEHEICGDVLKEDVVVRLRKMQLMVEGKEETVIAVVWVTDGVDRCRIGFLPRHMVKHAARYDGALAQVICVLSDDAATCDSVEQRMFHKNKGFCFAAIISTLPGSAK